MQFFLFKYKKAIDVFVGVTLILALVFKGLHWPFATNLLFVGLLAWTLYQFPGGIWLYYHPRDYKLLTRFNAFFGLGLCFFPMALLFNFLWLPGAGYLLAISVCFAWVVLLVSIYHFIFGDKKSSSYFKRIAMRALFYAVFASYYFYLQVGRFGWPLQMQ